MALALLAGCNDRNAAVDQATKAGILLINNLNDPLTLDPQLASGTIDLRIAGALFESLLNYNPQTLEPEPGAAESWEVSPDGLVFTFQLRKNARWSDGSPVTADDFLFAYERALNPRIAAPNALMIFGVKNARAFYEGKIKKISEVGFAAPDAHTLKITLQTPCSYFPSLVCNVLWAPLHRKTILQFGAIDERNTAWARPGSLVGNGAFFLKSWRVGHCIELERNENYRDAGNLKLRGVRFFAIGDSLAEERAFRGGLLHITSTVPPMKIRAMSAAGSPTLRIDPFFSTMFVRVNTRCAPLNDVRVRRALSLALIRGEITENVMRAGELPARSFTPPGAGDYASEFKIHENIAEARRLLAEAGYPDGKNFPKLVYTYYTQESARLVAEAMQAMWKKNLGIDIELLSQEWKVYRTAMESGEYQLIRANWSGDFLDPAAFLELFTSYSEQNMTGWADAQYDALIKETAESNDEAERFKKFRLAETRLLNALPVIPIAFNQNKFLIRPEVKGWYPNALDVHPLSAVSLEKPPESE